MAYGNAGKSDDGTGPVTNRSDAAAIIAALKDAGEVKRLEIGSGDGILVAVPKGVEVKDLTAQLDQLEDAPRQRSGIETVHDLASFINQVNRYKNTASQIWGALVIDTKGDVKDMTLTAVLDAPQGGEETAGGDPKARWGRHRVHYAFPLSREWNAWASIDGKGLEQPELAEFLERRLADVVPEPRSLFSDPVSGAQNERTAVTDPAILKLLGELDKHVATPSELVKITRSFNVNQSRKAEVSTDRDTGDIRVAYEEVGTKGPEVVRVPNLILVQAPVVVNGDRFMMAVHFRYRAMPGGVKFFLERHQPERVLELVFSEALDAVAEQTSLTPIRGAAPTWNAR